MSNLEVSAKDVDRLYTERSKYNNYGTIIQRLNENSARQLIHDAEKQISDVKSSIEYHQTMSESIEDFFLKKTHSDILQKRQKEYENLMSTQPDVWIADLKERLNRAEQISMNPENPENGQKQRDALFKDLMLTACVCNKNYRVDENDVESKVRVMLFGSVCSMEEVIERNNQNSAYVETMKEEYMSTNMKHDQVQRNFIPNPRGLGRVF